MTWAIAVLVIVVLGVAAAVAAGKLGEMNPEPVSDEYRRDLPDRPLTAADVAGLRFGVTMRGYAMDQVDELLDRLSREIADRDVLIADLTSAPGSAPAGSAEEGPDEGLPQGNQVTERTAGTR